MANVKSLHSILSTLDDVGDDGSIGLALAEWMARPCDPEETKWLSDNSRMMDWPNVLARRVEIVREGFAFKAR